jgi:shikimate dehydrogenase
MPKRKIHELTDLNQRISQVFLIGQNIQKSISPQLQNALFLKYKIKAKYSLLDFPKVQLASKIESLSSSKATLGFNVTAPYKQLIMPYLSHIDRTSRMIGAVNTVRVSNTGKMFGFNTDIVGILSTLDELKVSKNAKKAVILGAGGAARACAFVLLSRRFETICILNRSQARAVELADHFRNLFPRTKLEVKSLDSKIFEEEVKSADLLVNSISDESTHGHFPIEIDFNGVKKRELKVFDLGYKRESEVIRAARRQRIKHSDGLMMLALQAAGSFEIWTGKKPERGYVMSIVRRITA